MQSHPRTLSPASRRRRIGALIGLGLTLVTTGCQQTCELEEGYLSQVREGQRLLDDARDEYADYQRFVVEESPGVVVVNTSSQEELLRERVQSYLNDPDHRGDVRGVFGDPLVALYRDRWDDQIEAFEKARERARESFGALEAAATELNGTANELNQDDGCDGVDASQGWALYDEYRAFRRQYRRGLEVRAGSSADFIARVVAEWKLEQGDEEEPDAAEPPAPGVNVDLFDPDPVPDPAAGDCAFGGYLIGRVARVNGHALIVHTRIQWECSEHVFDEDGNLIGFLRTDEQGHRIVVDNRGNVLDVPAPACVPAPEDRYHAQQDALPELLEELQGRLRTNAERYGDTVTRSDGTTVTVDELTVDFLVYETTAERVFEVDECTWDDPVELAELRARMDRQLAAAVGLSPDEIDAAGEAVSSGTQEGVSRATH